MRAAVAALEAAGDSVWGDLDTPVRHGALELAARAFAAEPDPGGAWRSTLGVDVAGRVPGAAGLGRRLLAALRHELPLRIRRGALSASLVAVDECGGPGLAAEIVVRELAAGHPVVWLVSRALAGNAATFADALGSELEDGESPLRTVPVEGDLARVLVAASREGFAGRVQAALRASRVADVRAELAFASERPAHGAWFGAGVVGGPGFDFEVHALAPRRIVVRAGDDVARAARRAARHAFGLESAGGFLASAVGVAEVDPRAMSAFQAALLAALEEDAEPVPALPCGAAPAFREAFERVRRLGLDEGATLIHTGTTEPRGDAAYGVARRIAVRAVFTNGDPSTRFLREAEPAGILRIVRATDAAPSAAAD